MIAILECNRTLVDAFPLHAASPTAANAVLSSLLGVLLPLIGLGLYEVLDLEWGSRCWASLLGIVALALALAPILFAIFGEKVCTHSKARAIT